MSTTDEGPTSTWTCTCGAPMARYRGQGDQNCGRCGANYNACGQRLRDDWRGNPAWTNDDLSDLEGFEQQMLAREFGL